MLIRTYVLSAFIDGYKDKFWIENYPAEYAEYGFKIYR